MQDLPEVTTYDFTDPNSGNTLERPEDYLSPEQRRDAIAKLLAEIGLRALKNRNDKH